MKSYKTTAILYFLSSVCFYICAIFHFSNSGSLGTMYLCLGSVFLCLGATYLNKSKKEQGKKDKTDESDENEDEDNHSNISE